MVSKEDEPNTDVKMECQKNNDCPKHESRPSPILTAGLISKLTFWWVTSLVVLSRRRPLSDDDVHDVPQWARAGDNLSSFERRWTALPKDKKEKRGSLIIQMLIHFKGMLLCTLLLELFTEAIRFSQPLLVTALLVQLSQDKGTSDPLTYVYWVTLMLSIIAISLMNNHMHNRYDCIGMGMRTTCAAMIYKKVLTMSNQAHQQNKSGHIITLMSTDVEAFINALKVLHGLIFGPLWIIAFFASQVQTAGISIYVCVALIILVLVMQYLNAISVGKLRAKKEAETSKRVHFMSEVVSSMRIIKMYCWERPFAGRAKELRKTEMKMNNKRLIQTATSLAVNNSLSPFLTYIMIVIQFYMGIPVYPSNTITLLGLIKGMQLTVFMAFPYALMMLYELLSTTERIKKFILAEDQDDKPMLQLEDPLTVEATLKNASATWNQDQLNLENEQNVPFTLRNINLTAYSGDFIGITGKVGSGKSSILMALIGELPLSAGSQILHGSVAYVPQESWVLSETVRKNIILDLDFDEDRYNDILTACSLDLDMQQLPQGDLTLVGERGLSLSGGQKARVNLARAVYHDADIYLFDDPFAALDDKVGKQIFDRCINEMLKGKLRILVTHHLQYLSEVDTLLILDKGELTFSGVRHEVSQALRDYDHNLVQPVKRRGSIDVEYEKLTEYEEKGQSEIISPNVPEAVDAGNVKEPRDEITFAKKEEGQISKKVYLEFIRSGNSPLVFTVAIIFLLIVLGSDVFSSWLLSTWDSRDAKMSVNETDTIEALRLGDDSTYVLVGGLVILILIISAICWIDLLAWAENRCSCGLYNRMFDVVLRTPIDFFDRNPVGQILNRFSRDTGFMDYILFFPLVISLQTFGIAIAYVIYSCIVSPWMSIVAVIFFGSMVCLFQYTIPCIRELRRLEGACRSPTYSHLSATLQGLPVIRAFGKQQQFLEDAFSYMDTHTAAWYLFLSTQRFQSVGISLLAMLFGMIYITFTIFTTDFELGASGLSINSLVYLLGMWYLALMMFAELQIGMTSVERILQFSTLEQEAPEHTELKPPPGWPSRGKISITDMCVTYRGQTSPSLGPISVEIKPGEKVGVVGRTAAGKSSLFSGLLRMVEPTGSIKIDGLETAKIGLTDLRSRISVIPQDPVLFSGSLRFNLDPFQDFSDNQLWAALHQVQLASKVEGLAGGLSAEMGESGRNFSVGERQLLCLARALLRRNRIIIVDEATANVDNRTDSIIQATLQTEFIGDTVLTIAHRLNTIITHDKILVLDAGKCIEYGHPYHLLNDSSRIFYQMVQRLGPEVSEELQRIALASSKRRRSIMEHPNVIQEINTDECGYDNPTFTSL